MDKARTGAGVYRKIRGSDGEVSFLGVVISDGASSTWLLSTLYTT